MLRRIEKRHARATPGPWRQILHGDTELPGEFVQIVNDQEWPVVGWHRMVVSLEDTDFITEAWHDIDFLLAEVEQLREERRELREHVRLLMSDPFRIQ
jgi:hypothetical protein